MTPEFISLLITVAGAAAGVVAFFYRAHVKNLKEKILEVQAEKQAMKADYEERLIQVGTEKVKALRLQIVNLQEAVKAADGKLADSERRRTEGSRRLEEKQVECVNLKDELGQREKEVEVLGGDFAQARDDIDRLDRERKARNNRVRHAMELEGQIWTKEPLQAAPPFRPLQERRFAVLSLLNLKGGVGKTTVAAYLAEAFARRGYRVLLVDLDLQGSLSSLFLPYSELSKLDKSQRLLQHYLTAASRTKKARLHEYAEPVRLPGLDESHPGRLHVVCATDYLAYAEQALTLQWLLRIGKFDARFLLRQGLHGKWQVRQVARKFDIVFMDCPPIMNTCCVNALAASDYVVVPVTPSQKAAERVPVLLKRLKQLKDVVHPQLELMGLLPNRCSRGNGLTDWERDAWDHLRAQCQDQWGLPVKVFDTVVPRRDTEVRGREESFGPVEQGGDLSGLFGSLAEEVEGRLPGDCRRSAEVCR